MEGIKSCHDGSTVWINGNFALTCKDISWNKFTSYISWFEFCSFHVISKKIVKVNFYFFHTVWVEDAAVRWRCLFVVVASIKSRKYARLLGSFEFSRQLSKPRPLKTRSKPSGNWLMIRRILFKLAGVWMRQSENWHITHFNPVDT